ncbi:MAG TPA: hypothetical protein VNA17_03265, partial [Pyrinomonadaceae bacterium]|nr:hypothetical protein [Pyrinomonadaceae bacterium]
RLSPYLRPHFVTEDNWSQITKAGETIFGALQKVKDAAIADAAVLDELGVTDIERDLILIDPGYAHVSPTSRLDSFLTDEAYSYVELNGESPAGIAFADSATEIFRSLPVMKRFNEKYATRGLEGSSKMLDVLLDCYEEFLGRRPERNPTIAIVDLQDRPTIKEFELFKEYFESRGFPSVICSPDQLEYANDRLTCDGTTIDIVYKRLLVNEYLPIMHEHGALLEAYRARAVCMVNSFRGKLVHKKAVFAVLTNEKYEHLFDEKELTAIRDHVPWTRVFRDEKTRVRTGSSADSVPSDDSIALVEWTRANAQKLVLKPNDDYGGHGIYIGWNSSPAEWDDAISAALADGDYLVQLRVKTARESFPMIKDDAGNWEMVEQLVDLDPLLFMGKVGSAFTRLSSNELANVTAGGGMVPTFILSE